MFHSVSSKNQTFPSNIPQCDKETKDVHNHKTVVFDFFEPEKISEGVKNV